MKNLNYPVVLLLLLFTVFSCNDEINEPLPLETTEASQVSETTTSVKSLVEINDQLLLEQLPKSEKHLKKIIATAHDYLLKEHNLDNLFFDEENVFVEENSDNRSYTFIATIPHLKEDETLNQHAYLTLNFNADAKISNQVSFGFQMDQHLSFDGEGNILNNDKYSYYTPKPKGLPNKVPKSVICNYYIQNIDQFSGGPLASYCGIYYGGVGPPVPLYILNAILAPQLTHNYNDLYILNPSHPNGQVPFPQYYSYYFPGIKNEIIDYYQQIFIPQLGYTITVTSNITAAKHLNKQAFIDSFYNWLYTMQSNASDTFYYLANNPDVMYQLFNFFAEYNMEYDEFEGVYLGIPYGQYAPNPDIVCVTLASQHLLTPDGFTLLEQLGSGSITIEEFRDALPGCS